MDENLYNAEFTHETPELIDTSIFPGDLEFPFTESLPAILQFSPEIYHRTKAFSNTFAKRLIKESLHHAQVSMNQNSGMRKGSAIDVALRVGFERLHRGEDVNVDKLIEETIAVAPPYEGAGRVQRKKEFEEANADKPIITNSEIKSTENMIRSALQNQDFRRYFHGDWQVAIFWEEDGVPCKALLDHLVKNKLTRNLYKPIDLKSTRNRGIKGFADAIKENMYDMQVAHYDSALRHLYGEENIDLWSFAVCESNPPYATALYDINNRIYEAGYIKREYALNEVRDYMNGRREITEYPTFPHQEIDIPEYYYDQSLNYRLTDDE